MDGDDPETALSLVHDLAEDAPGQAYPIALWIAEAYPEIFDAHLMLARLSLARGDPQASRGHAPRGLDALEKQGDDVDPEAREWVLEEFRDVVQECGRKGAFRPH